jgi:putative restriction endonuclease
LKFSQALVLGSEYHEPERYESIVGFGVFVHRSDSIYDDSPAERYQFPSQYLRRVEGCVGDWIIYYEPRKVIETRGYFAVAKVQRVIPDPGAPGMYLALIEPGSYLDFASPVPFSGPDGIAERGVLNEQGRISGRAQSAVRPISPIDFDRIIGQGLEQSALLPRLDDAPSAFAFQEDQVPFQFEQSRDRIQYFTSRIVRDRVFRRIVLRAYGERCAITGLKLINGGGRAEVAAAHIRPVEADGPDIVSNGIALSGTAHWMFDRGLISLTDNLEILVSRHVNDPDGVRGIINKSGRALRPERAFERPHPHFLQWHREHCFKQ